MSIIWILFQISRKILDRNHKEKVTTALQQLEYNGGKVRIFFTDIEVLNTIKIDMPSHQLH